MKHLEEMLRIFIPTSFELAGQTFRVEFHDEVKSESGSALDGDFCPQTNIIKVALLNEGQPKAVDAICQAYYHEFAHAALFVMANPLWKNEKFVDALGQFMWQYEKSKIMDDI